jgi:hypothetical protein
MSKCPSCLWTIKSPPFITMLIYTVKTASWPDYWGAKTTEKQKLTQEANCSLLQCNKWIHPFAKCQVNISLGSSCVSPSFPAIVNQGSRSLPTSSCQLQHSELRTGLAGTVNANTASLTTERKQPLSGVIALNSSAFGELRSLGCPLASHSLAFLPLCIDANTAFTGLCCVYLHGLNRSPCAQATLHSTSSVSQNKWFGQSPL